MSELKMPELNNIYIAGNLTKDPIFRQTSNGTPVVNFTIASNRKFKDNGKWMEDVCYVGIVAWNKLADSCKDRLKKGSAVLIDGELQSRSWKTDDGHNRSIVEIKARRIQFLNKKVKDIEGDVVEEDFGIYTDDSFDKFINGDVVDSSENTTTNGETK